MTSTQRTLIRKVLNSATEAWEMIHHNWGQGRLGQTRERIADELNESIKELNDSLPEESTEGKNLMEPLTTKEMMLIAGLRGDDVAALAYADMIQENRKEGLTLIKPLREVVDVNNIRVMIFYKQDLEPSAEDINRTNRAITEWVSGRATIFHMTGVDRIEIYSIPIIKDEQPPIMYPPKERETHSCYRG